MKCVYGLVLAFVLQASALAGSLDDVVWVTEEYPPFNYRENGEVKGMSVDVLAKIWEKAGLKKTAKDIKLYPWARGVKMAKTKPNTCLFTTTLTAERQNDFGWKFVYPLPQVSTESRNRIMALKSKNISFASAADLKKYAGKFGVVNGDIGASLLAGAGVGTAQMDANGSPDSLIKKFKAGRFDVISYAYDTTIAKMKEHGLDMDKYEVVYNFPNAPVGLAFHRDTDQAVVDSLQKILDELIASGVVEEIRQRYIKK